MKVTGGCHCGHIIYEAEVDPTTVRGLSLHGFPKTDRHGVSDQHCKSARNIRAEERDAKIYIKTAESGSKRAHGFCPECGTPIYSAAPEPNPSRYALRVGAIEERTQFAPPIRQIWCQSAFALVDEFDRCGASRAAIKARRRHSCRDFSA